MSESPPLAIIWHSRTGAAEAMARAAAEGAGDQALLLAAAQASPEALLGAGGYLFVCPENLGRAGRRGADRPDRHGLAPAPGGRSADRQSGGADA